MAVSSLSVEEVRAYISDYPESNLLLDKEEFSDTMINLCMGLAVDSFNAIPPRSRYNQANIPSKEALLFGTLFHLYNGKAAQMARNHLSYTDGGLQIPVEEKYELYAKMAETYGAQFEAISTKLKISMNMELGWGEVRGDAATFPIW